QIYNGPTINNLAGGIFEFADNATIPHYSGTEGTFNNAGTIRKTGGTGVSSIDDRLNHTAGSIDVQTGTLELFGATTASTFTAPVTVSAPATLQFASNGFTLGTGFSASGAGHVNLAGATLTTADSLVFRQLSFSNGRLGGTGVVQVTDTLLWTAGTLGNDGGRTRIPALGLLLVSGNGTRYLQTHTLFNSGRVLFPAGTTGAIQIYNGPTINNLAGGIFEFADNATIP